MWKSVPALRAAVAFGCGIACAAQLSTSTYAAALGTSLAALGTIGYFLPVALERRGVVRGGATLLLLTCAGFAYQLFRAPPPPESAFAKTEYFVARLTEAPTGKANWAGADAVVLEAAPPRTALGAHTAAAASGRSVRLMFERARETPLPARGAVVVSNARLSPVDGPRNPHAFDYRAYLAQRGVGLQAWLRAVDFAVVSPAPAPGILMAFRMWIGARIDAGFAAVELGEAPAARDAGVAKALLIGDKSGIDEETRLAYTATGAVHVLAVSGLHTGVISAIVVFLLGRAFGKRLPWLQFGVLLLAMLAYVALTGFAPSVIRASIMFAVVFGGRFWRKDAQGLNSLGVAAVLTLLYDPNLLHTLGFQLSYLAVAGIMLFYAPLRRLLRTSYPGMHHAEGLLAVSVAATLGTFPVTIFHFHQFPVYFALSGLIAVPLVGYALPLLLGTLALDGLLATFAVDWPPLYYPARLLVWLCNEALALLARLPHVLVEGLWPSAGLSVLLLSMVWALGVTAQTRRRRALRITMALAVLSTSVAVFDLSSQRHGSSAVAYSLREASVVDVRAGVYTSSSSDGRVDARALRREVEPHRYATGYAPHRASEIVSIYADSAVAFYTAGGHRWAELRGRPGALTPMSWRIDWVRVEEPSAVDPAALATAFPDAHVLLARRPPPWERAAWAPLAERTHLLSEGAYVLESDR